jgi:PAS domain S-box-containing protein
VVRPAPRHEDNRGGYLLVLFESAEPGASADEKGSPQDIERDGSLTHLEEENARLRVRMDAALEHYETHAEELKAANEELQAMNEELRSTTEELETSKEELQSTNEELQTVNQELKVKIEELSQSADDVRNLMSSTEIGTIFLDRSLRVKLFTPCARDIFNLIGGDLGRPLLDITTKLAYDGIAADAERVLERLSVVEREVQTREGRWYLMRLLPYRTAEDRIDGVVITLVEITERKAAEERLRASEERLRLTIESVPDCAIFTLDPEGRIATWNMGAEQMFGYGEGEIVGRDVGILFVPEDRERGVHEEEMRCAREQGWVLDERWHLRKDGSRFFASGVLAPLRGGDRLIGYTKLARDLTARRREDEAVRRSHQELEEKVRERTHELADAIEALRKEIVDRSRSEAQRLGLLRQLVSAQETERRRISRELHDQFGQQVSALTIKLAALQSSAEMAAPLREELRRLERITRELDSELEFFLWELRPTALEDLGLKEAITDYAENWSRRYGTPARVHVRGLDNVRLAGEVESVLYRITQEALNNVAKHARAHGADVILERRAGEVTLIIEDDGVGFDTERALSAGKGGGLGLIGMRERAALVGGSVEVESSADKGTTVFVRIPLPTP